jgi:hypothetical protein
MVQSKTKKQRARNEGQKTKLTGYEDLISKLPEHVVRRLEILTEDSDAPKVISDAIMSLWQQRYPAQASTQKEPDEPSSVVQPTAPAVLKGTSRSVRKAGTTRKRSSTAKKPAIMQPEPVEATDQSATATDETVSGILPSTDAENTREQVQAMRDDGMSLTAIAAKLNEDTVPTLSGSGRWHHTAVKRLLRR